MAVAALSAGLAVSAQAFGEVVERHLPQPPPAATQPTVRAPAAPTVSDDNRPLGATLRAIVLLGPSDAVAEIPATGVMAPASLPRLAGPAARRLLAAYIGKPITKALITRIEAAIVKRYRRAGFPFVSVTTPEQEIGQGVLRVRVVEFRLGALKVAGASRRQAALIRRGIRLTPGEAIDEPRLAQDLDWLGRDPYVAIAPAFTPGAEPGQSDLDLAVTRQRPWQIQAGWSNSGSQPSDQSRYFMAATVGGLGLADSVLSVLVTGSPDFWAFRGSPFVQAHPVYESIAGQFSAPTGPRQDIELSVDAEETNQPNQDFVVREQTLEATLAWRWALSNLMPLPGDVRLGLEAQSQRRMTFFGGSAVAGGAVNVYQLTAGWTDSWSDAFGHGTVDIAIHGAPGGVDDLNTGASLAAFTQGRVTAASYVYADVSLSRTTPIWRGFVLGSQLIGQYAGQPLPDSDQTAIGGAAAVRGYYLDAGAFDDSIVLRDTLYGPSLNVSQKRVAASRLSPFGFIDVAEGRNEATRQTLGLASVGLGADLQVTRFAAANLTLAYPLATAPFTPAGDWRLEASVTLSY